MEKINRIKYIMAAMLALFVFALTTILTNGVGGKAYAASNEYSSVIIDLTKDSKFNFMEYPEDKNDYSLQVIQIAESENGELFVYLYQPSAKNYKFTLQTIRLSTSRDDGGWKDYNLAFLSSWGTLLKYRVDDFTVSEAKERYYNITALHRDYEKYIDDGSLSLNKGIAVKVAQLWMATTINGSVSYSMETIDTITVTDCKYGSLRVPAGFNFANSYACDMHIIAFNTDIEMDQLLEADVEFDYRSVDKGLYDTDYGKWEHKEVTVNYKEKGSTTDHLFGDTPRTWDKIQSSSEFLNTCAKFDISLSSEITKDIRNKKWVLAFWETGFQNDTGGVFGFLTWIGAAVGFSYNHYTQVSNATVLRLEFNKDGEHYNLGVVSNKSGDFDVIGGGDKPFDDYAKDLIKNKVLSFFEDILNEVINFFKNSFGGKWWIWIIIAVVALLVGVPVLSALCPVVGKILLIVVNSVWAVISAPFKLIAKLFKRKE